MSALNDLIFLPDLISVKREYLEPIAIDNDIAINNSATQICNDIWGKMQSSYEVKNAISSNLNNVVFAGNTSVSWFLFPNAKEYFITDSLPSEIIHPIQAQITSTPSLIGAARIDDNNILLRFIVKSGTYNQISGFSLTTAPKTSLITTMISLNQDFIEVRSDPKMANKIIQYIKTNFINCPEAALIKIENFTDESIEDMADNLHGKLIETVSHPENLIEDITEEQVTQVLSIIDAIDGYFMTYDSAQLVDRLNDVEFSSGNLVGLPFAALVLAGMDKVGMGTIEEDLRKKVLFSFLRPHITYLKGFIKFPVIENGISKEYTIRVGIDSKSIYFNSTATEKVIETVRNQVLKINKK